jgi:hypothetical protein
LTFSSTWVLVLTHLSRNLVTTLGTGAATAAAGVELHASTFYTSATSPRYVVCSCLSSATPNTTSAHDIDDNKVTHTPMFNYRRKPPHYGTEIPNVPNANLAHSEPNPSIRAATNNPIIAHIIPSVAHSKAFNLFLNVALLESQVFVVTPETFEAGDARRRRASADFRSHHAS